MNIKELDETTIKAFLYDLMIEKQNIQHNIELLQNELAERKKKQEEKKEESEKDK